MLRFLRMACAATLVAAVGCEASAGGGGRGEGSPGGDGVAGGPPSGPAGACGAAGYYDLDCNPISQVYDISGNPVTMGDYEGTLYDVDGKPVYDTNGKPASWGDGSTSVDLDNCTAAGAEAEVGLQGADIIWIVDNSCSMAAEAAAVQANLNRFATTLVDQGIDVHLVLISSANVDDGMMMQCAAGDWACLAGGFGGFDFGVCIDQPFGSGMCPNDSNPPNFLHLNNSVGSRNALEMLISLYPMYSHMMRPNAVKHFAIITDDESAMDAATFSNNVTNLDPVLFAQWYFHGIYSMTNCADAANIGTVYRQLVAQTGGVEGDLCTQMFDPVFDKLAMGVAEKAEIACDWPIPEPPDGQFLDRNKVNVQYTQPDMTVVSLARIPDGEQCDGREGWFYDDPSDPKTVVSCPASCDIFQTTGGRVDVLFGCDSVLVE